MIDAEEKSIDGNQPEQSFGGIIMSTALASVKWILIAAALGATLFCCLFPYSAMNIYRNLGNYEKALEYCDACMEQTPDKQSSEYSALLVNAINISSYLLGEQIKDNPYDGADGRLTNAAEKVKAYTDEFRALPVAVCSARANAVDRYNLENSPPDRHPFVYKFEEYVYNRYAYAAALCGDLNVALSSADTLVTAVTTADTVTLAMSGLNAYFDYEFYRAGYTGSTQNKVDNALSVFVNNGKLSYVFDNIVANIDDIQNIIETAANYKPIDRVYAALLLSDLAYNLHISTYVFAHNYTSDITAQRALTDAASKAQFSYFSGLYKDYILANTNV